MVKRIPEGYRSITPYLVIDGAVKEIHFLRQAFGAAEKFPPLKRSDDTIMHAEMRIGDSVVMLAEASEQYRAMPS